MCYEARCSMHLQLSNAEYNHARLARRSIPHMHAHYKRARAYIPAATPHVRRKLCDEAILRSLVNSYKQVKMGIGEYLFDTGCGMATFQDNCEFEIIDIKVTEVILFVPHYA